MDKKSLSIFCRQIRDRSRDNREAISLLAEKNVPQMISILRQELDSMIRVIYLLSIKDKGYRDKLIELSINGKKWMRENGKGKVTDRDMVDLSSKLHGWAQYVYKFGCGFIHLSSFHDYKARDPLDMIAKEEKEDIIAYLRQYHFGPNTKNVTFKDVIPYLPSVFEKIRSNLECYLKDLEKNETLS